MPEARINTGFRHSNPLFKLDRCWRLGGIVEQNTVDMLYFVYDAVCCGGNGFGGQQGNFRGHKVGRGHSAQGDGVIIGALITHNTNAAHVGQRGKILAGALGFGGCCVILQNAAFGVPLGRYVLQKTVTAALAAGIYLLLERAFPGDVPTFSGDSAEKQGLVWVICMLPVAVFFLKNLFLNNSNSRDFREKTAKNRNI